MGQSAEDSRQATNTENVNHRRDFHERLRALRKKTRSGALADRESESGGYQNESEWATGETCQGVALPGGVTHTASVVRPRPSATSVYPGPHASPKTCKAKPLMKRCLIHDVYLYTGKDKQLSCVLCQVVETKKEFKRVWTAPF